MKKIFLGLVVFSVIICLGASADDEDDYDEALEAQATQDTEAHLTERKKQKKKKKEKSDIRSHSPVLRPEEDIRLELD